MDDALGIGNAVKHARQIARRNRIALLFGNPGLRRVVKRDVPEFVAVIQQQIAEAGPADAHGVLQHCCEYRFQLAGRATDHSKTSEVAACCSSASASSLVRVRSASN